MDNIISFCSHCNKSGHTDKSCWKQMTIAQRNEERKNYFKQNPEKNLQKNRNKRLKDKLKRDLLKKSDGGNGLVSSLSNGKIDATGDQMITFKPPEVKQEPCDASYDPNEYMIDFNPNRVKVEVKQEPEECVSTFKPKVKIEIKPEPEDPDYDENEYMIDFNPNRVKVEVKQESEESVHLDDAGHNGHIDGVDVKPTIKLEVKKEGLDMSAPDAADAKPVVCTLCQRIGHPVERCWNLPNAEKKKNWNPEQKAHQNNRKRNNRRKCLKIKRDLVKESGGSFMSPASKLQPDMRSMLDHCKGPGWTERVNFNPESHGQNNHCNWKRRRFD